MMPTVLAHRASLLRLSCRPLVCSLLLLFSACRNGVEPPFGRPGAWQDGRDRLQWGSSCVRPAGNATQWDMGGRDLQIGAIRPNTQGARQIFATTTEWAPNGWRPVRPEFSHEPRSGSARMKPSVARPPQPFHPQPVSDPRLLPAAGRRDHQVLGLQRRRSAWARRHRKPGRRCRRSLPTELHHCVVCVCLTCSHSCFCSPCAEMGANLPAVDLGPGRTAVVVSLGSRHTCALLVRFPIAQLRVENR